MATPLLIKYGQDLPNVGWFTANAAHAATRPFDGVMLYLTAASNGVIVADPLDRGDVEAEMGGFHAAPLGQLAHNFPVVRTTCEGAAIPDWWDDEAWATIAANWGAFTAGVRGARVAGIAWDNEHYHTTGPALFDWRSGDGIDPSHTLAQSRAQVRRRGRQCMSAVLHEWPDVRLLALHGPYVSDARTGVDIWTGAAGDEPYWNPVAHANELQASFFYGLLDAVWGWPAELVDGGEVYAVRSLAAMRNVRYWQTRGIAYEPASGVPGSLEGCQYRPAAGQGIMDLDEFADPPWSELQSPAALQAQITWAMHTSDLAWYYSEGHDWWEGGWGSHVDIDDPSQAAWFAAVEDGRAAGKVI